MFYRVRKEWDMPDTQIGTFTLLENAKSCVDLNPGYAAFDEKGNCVYRGTDLKETRETE